MAARQYFGGPISTRRGDLHAVYVGVALVASILFSSLALIFLLTPHDKAVAAVSANPIVQGERTVDVLIPVADIEANSPLRPAMFRRDKMPWHPSLDGAISNEEEIANRYARTLIVANHPIYTTFLSAARGHGDRGLRIPLGYRAVTIPVTKLSAFDGWLQPQDKVDVVVITKRGGETCLKPLLFNITVVSLEIYNDPSLKPGTLIPQSVTLLLAPEQANEIHLATEVGLLKLSLRSQEDEGKIANVTTICSKTLTGDPHPQPVEDKRQGRISVGGVNFNIREDGRWERIEQ